MSQPSIVLLSLSESLTKDTVLKRYPFDHAHAQTGIYVFCCGMKFAPDMIERLIYNNFLKEGAREDGSSKKAERLSG